MNMPPGAVRPREWVPAAALWLFFFAVARATAHATYSVTDLAAVAVLYGLAAWTLDNLARLLGTTGKIGQAAGALFAGLVLAWHFREQTRPAGVGDTLWAAAAMSRFLGTAVALATLYCIIGYVSRRRPRTSERDAKRADASDARQADPSTATTKRAAALFAASAAALLIALGIGFFASNTLRWHLLQQNLLLGTPAYHLFATPANRLEGEAWARHSGGASLGQPGWVLDLADAEPGVQPTASGASGSTAATAAPTLPAPATAPVTTAGGQRPDIVFIMLDTLRADVLEAYGGEPSLMPALNAYAADSWLFADVLANASWTRPSLGSFFTGLLPEEHGATGLRFALSPSVKMLAEILSAQGYETAAFNANGRMVNAISGFDRGFDVFESLRDQPGYARADFVTDRVGEWLAQRRLRDDDTRPLFLYVHYLDPHTPYLSSPGTDFRENPVSHEVARQRYADEVRFLDIELERLLEMLDDELVAARLTLVASDHGEEFGEHGARGHAQTLYSEVLDIPVVARLQGFDERPAAGVVEAPLEGRDFFDLMLRAAIGEPLDIPQWAGGRSRDVRVATVAFEKLSGPSAFFQDLLRPYRKTIYARMIQQGSWRFIWSAYGSTDELYDLAADPGELANVAPGNRRLAAALREQLDGMPPYWVGLVPINVSPAALEQLRALGYLR